MKETRNFVKLILFILLSIMLVSCGGEKKEAAVTKGQADIDYNIILKGSNKPISYINEAKPVIEKRCVVCHGCYDAPCQLKLTSIEGIKRGASPLNVYDSERILAANPTRLFIDAHSEKEWREKGFHTVLNSQPDKDQPKALENNLRHSVLYKMLRLKQLNPQPKVGMLDESYDFSLNRKNTCPTDDSFQNYENKFAMHGMPFAMPNLSDDEYHILVKWISQGLPDDSNNELPEVTKQQVRKWEEYLNKNDIKHQLFSRYLYEHLVLGHIHFKGANPREFFQLVRSYTPPGKKIEVIGTTRPFDSPGVDVFYYRLKYYTSSIVDKNHVVYELSDKRMQRYNELFFSTDYTVSKLPSYSPKIATNPTKAFAELPLNSRYRFLLDDSKFFIEGFIKGPVCRGQVALNVIEDNFWVFFMSPDKLRVNNDDEYMATMSNALNLPAEDGNTLNVFSIWTKYWNNQKKYMKARQKDFEDSPTISLNQAMDFIWDGSDGMDKNNRSLTIYRHFDSATVKQGMLGDYPESAWILDYPILERIHYLLVAGYDVYGNVGHQVNTRIYMDFLRMESENNFLAFMPVKYRTNIQQAWYKGIREDVKRYFNQPSDWLGHEVVTGFKTDNPQQEFYVKLENKLKGPLDDRDYINRCGQKECKNKKRTSIDYQLQRIDKIEGESLIVFPDVSFLKIKSKKKDRAYTLIVNKAYKNISFVLNSVKNRDRSLDTMSIYHGLLGSYPNFFFVVDESELDLFTDRLLEIRNRNDYERFVGIYGIRRTSTHFWEVADWFNQQYAKQDPVGYGIYDLNRYSNR